ncbi:MAG TPA: GTP 3',8-cyclase MoaA [Candidatus Polarisedimenticolaceae bacterium]|nr:GTP 3',8-cyclase MoaA [Candidatus Polarisedimenticolaceae bacterium]
MVLRDGFGRVHDDLRVSVTDRCNLRCAYCMPQEPVWFDRAEILRYEEILRLVRIALDCGVRKVRLTGGEPLVRRDVARLVALLAAEPRLEDLALTTNGVLLEAHAAELAAAGLRRVNVSLDTLDPARFARLTRRPALERVLRGIAAAVAAGLGPIKVNTVLVRGINDDEAEPLVAHAREHGWELRFIEYMPLDNERAWDPARVVSGAELRERIHARWPLEPDRPADPHAPAARWRFRDGRGAVGFIDSVTAPFCASCSRLRLTADGRLRVCLYDDRETDLKAPLRAGAPDELLAALLERAVRGKGRGGALEILERQAALPLARTMHQIGG